MDAMAVVIQRKWPKLEGSSEELGDTMVELLDAMRRQKIRWTAEGESLKNAHLAEE